MMANLVAKSGDNVLALYKSIYFTIDFHRNVTLIHP